MKRLTRHTVLVIIVVLTISAAGIGTWVSISHQISGLKQPPPPLRSSVTEPASPNVPLSLTDAEVELISRPRRMFAIVPIGTDKILSYDVTIVNEEEAGTSCRAVTRYAGPSGEDSDRLLFGSWSDLYDGKDSGHNFEIPAKSAANYLFFWFPKRMKVWPLDWVRVRVICEKPTKQFSRWYDINLSRVEWP